MFLTFRNIAHYLLDQGFITKSDIFENNLIISPVESRNNSFMIKREGKKSYFLKQVKMKDRERTSTLKTEADCYWLAENHHSFQDLAAFIPTYVNYDYINHILVTECLTDTQNLSEFYYREKELPLTIAEQQAYTLAACHRETETHKIEEKVLRLFPQHKPSVFSLNAQNLEYWQEKDKASEQMVNLIKGNKNFLSLLEEAGQDWQANTLIHGDVKHSNFLLRRASNKPEVFLIDWEIAAFGDPAWDIAGVLQNYLLYWIDGETRKGEKSFTHFTLENLIPSIACFKRTYCKQTQMSRPDAEKFFAKALRYTGVKLVQTCRESLRDRPAISDAEAMMLQLSLNILSDPQGSAEQLLQAA